MKDVTVEFKNGKTFHFVCDDIKYVVENGRFITISIFEPRDYDAVFIDGFEVAMITTKTIRG